MAKFTLRKASTQPLTRELAHQFNTMMPSPTERSIIDSHLDFLQEKHDVGLLVTFHWATVTIDGITYRANGQHSSRMLANLPEPFPSGLFVHIDEYDADDMEGGILLYRQFDTRQSARSPLDIYKSYQGGVPALKSVNPKIGKLGIEGIAWYLTMVEKVPTPKGDDIYTMVLNTRYHDFLLWLSKTMTIKAPECCNRYVIAAMYATTERYNAEAYDFWYLVTRGGKEYQDQHQSTILDKWLNDAKEKTLKVEPGPGGLYQGCLYAWNAFRDEKTILNIRIDSRKGLHELLD